MRNDKYVKTRIVHDGNPFGLPRLLVSIDMDGVIDHPEIYGKKACDFLKIIRASKENFFDLKEVFLIAGNDPELLVLPNEAYRMIKEGFGKNMADIAKYQGSNAFHNKLIEKIHLLVDCLYSSIHPDKEELLEIICHIVELFPEGLEPENIVAETNFTFKEALFIRDFLAKD